jgi:hypothetical protein
MQYHTGNAHLSNISRSGIFIAMKGLLPVLTRIKSTSPGKFRLDNIEAGDA